MAGEETKRRTEASLAKKRINKAAANGTAASDSAGRSQSPADNVALQLLMEQLSAVESPSRQRARRRRPRVEERHEVRIDSGESNLDLPIMGIETDKSENGQDVAKDGNSEP